MKKKFFIPLLLCGCLLATACKKTKQPCDRGPVNTNCICPGVVSYVCGCDNQTYENACQAECNGITTYTVGRCP